MACPNLPVVADKSQHSTAIKRRIGRLPHCVFKSITFLRASRMRKLAIVFAALALGRPAFAADMAVKAPPPAVSSAEYNWAGFYLGVNAGGHWGKDSDPAFVSANNNFPVVGVANLNLNAPVTLDPAGFAGGAQLGYNWQWSRLVLGVEADFDGLSGSSTRTLLDPPVDGTFNDSAKDRWMATARIRAGYAVDHVLLYVTGGAAWSNWQTSHAFAEVPSVGAVIGSENSTFTRSGWTAGGGLEYAFADNWLARVEYLYADFGTANNTLVTSVPGIPGGGFITNFAEPEKLTEQVVRAGVSYKFP
jgi:outer membrane immunogenic protein